MKVKSFFINDRKYMYRWCYIIFSFYVIGIIVGAVYCISLSRQNDISVHSYLTEYFTQLKDTASRFDILKNSLCDSIKLFVIIFLSSFVRPGIILIFASVGVKGFISGFTIGSFVKYYGAKGLFVGLASLPSALIFLPTLILFAANSSVFSVNRQKSEKIKVKRYIALSICCFTIFCVGSLSDAFITTTFMKLLSPVFSF